MFYGSSTERAEHGGPGARRYQGAQNCRNRRTNPLKIYFGWGQQKKTSRATRPDDNKTTRFEQSLFAVFAKPCGRRKLRKISVRTVCKAVQKKTRIFKIFAPSRAL